MTLTTRITPPERFGQLHLGEVWTYRELLLFFIWRDLKVRYQQTIIGVGWVILQPLMTTFAFSLPPLAEPVDPAQPMATQPMGTEPVETDHTDTEPMNSAEGKA